MDKRLHASIAFLGAVFAVMNAIAAFGAGNEAALAGWVAAFCFSTGLGIEVVQK